MSKISRNNMKVRDETGPDWFNDFLMNISKTSSNTTQEILSTIHNSEPNTVEGVVARYRESVGLDAMALSEPAIKKASVRRALSSRDVELTVVDKIKESEEAQLYLESIFKGTGGTKGMTSVIRRLKEILPEVAIRYRDKDLLEYLSELRNNHYRPPGARAIDYGVVGTEEIDSDADDHMADYIKYDGTANL